MQKNLDHLIGSHQTYKASLSKHLYALIHSLPFSKCCTRRNAASKYRAVITHSAAPLSIYIQERICIHSLSKGRKTGHRRAKKRATWAVEMYNGELNFAHTQAGILAVIKSSCPFQHTGNPVRPYIYKNDVHTFWMRALAVGLYGRAFG